MRASWQVLLSLLLQGAAISVVVTIAGTAIALILGLVLALARISAPRPLRILATAYVQIIRCTPLLLQVFILFYVLPFAGIDVPPMTAGIAGLALNYAAYMSEVYRAGILSVDKGQREAAVSLGMAPSHIMRRIILPQTVRIVVPALGNFFIGMFKDSAIVSVITLNELLYTAQRLSKLTFQSLLLYTMAAAIYFAMSFPGARLVSWLETRLKRERSEQGPQPAAMALPPDGRKT